MIRTNSSTERGSAFIIVLWIAFGLVSVCLYFGHTMSLELRASDNQVSGAASAQAIEGAVRYLNNLLAYQCSYGSNGMIPDPTTYSCEAVAVGDAHFWIIGRDTNTTTMGLASSGQIAFGLIDEGSKLNLNSASVSVLSNLFQLMPNISQDLPAAISEWRSTNNNGTYQSAYSIQSQPYQNKGAPFETLDELRLVYGAEFHGLLGEDLNRNGVLDPGETDENHNGVVDPGILEYTTIYSREPNTQTNGQPKVNIRTVTSTGPLPTLLNTAVGSTRANQILINLGVLNAGGATGGGRRGGGGASGGGARTATFTSVLQFFRASRMTADEFAKIANSISLTNGAYIDGRVNINTASADVLASLPGLSADQNLPQTLISYRQTNPDKLTTIAWIVDAVGQNNASALNALQATDSITVQSYQFTADIAAVGPHGRGYRRVRFVFDTSSGAPKIIYRQDLTGLGWALGKEARDTWLTSRPQNNG